MESSTESVSAGCRQHIKLLTLLIGPMHRPRLMSDCCTTRLIYAEADSYRSRRCKLSAKINGQERERESDWGLGQLFCHLHADERLEYSVRIKLP